MIKNPMTKDEIKKALKVKGICPVDLAKIAGISRSMVSHIDLLP